MSSLAAQLAKNASLNSALLSSRRKATESYLFTGREADRHDLDSIHALGINSLQQLVSLNHNLRKFEDILFSNAVKGIDRTLLSVDSNTELNKHLGNFLPMLGPYLMDPPTGKVIEWLVRRFRINEFNVEDILMLFWPYHESPHFAKMLTILHIKEQSTWRFLLPHKAAAQSVPRISLVSEMLKNVDVARFVSTLLPNALKGGYAHRTLIAFNAATLHDFILRSKSLDEGSVAFLLPALLDPLQNNSSEVDVAKDSILGSYVLLSALSRKCRLSSKALRTIVGVMASCAHRISSQQFISAVVSVCEPQDELDNFSDATVKSVLRLSNIDDELRQSLTWLGIEKFVGPMILRLVSRLHEPEAAFVQSLIMSSNVPEIITQRISALLMKKIVDQGTTTDEPAALQLLSTIYQRHPSIVRKVGDGLGVGDPSNKSVQDLLLSLSTMNRNEIENGLSRRNSAVDTIVASSNIDPPSRKTAVIALLNTLTSTNTNLETSEKESIQSALLARVYDTDAQVLEALYVDPMIINSVFSINSTSYLDNLELSLLNPASKPSRSILRTHLAFLILHFCPAIEVDIQFEVFHRVLFPLLLFSKSRQRATEAVWEIIAKAEDQNTVTSIELLVGCSGMWKRENAKEQTSALDLMSEKNSALASKIAENVLISNNYPRHLEQLLGKLGASNPHSRVLGYLTMHALLSRLRGTNQMDAVRQILQVMQLDPLTDLGGSSSDCDDPTDPAYNTSLAKSVILKPSSRRILQSLQISILALIAQLPHPTGVVIDWLANHPCGTAHGKVDIYVEIMRTVYGVSHSSGAHSLKLLRILFDNLGEDSLAFLAGIWTSSADHELRVASLRHADAFLQAYCSAEHPLDFQTILPSLLVALQSLDNCGRQTAFECIAQLVVSKDRRFCAVYGLDSIYGSGSATLQFLGKDDYQRYVGCLVEHKAHLIADPNYLNILHRQHLGKGTAEKKKDVAYKESVLCYLLSHVNSISSSDVQMRLLNIVDEVSDSLKAELLLPLVRELIEESHPERLTIRFGSNLENIAGSVTSSFDHSIAAGLNNEDSALWPVFMTALTHYFSPGSLSSPRITLANNLTNGLFVSLTLDHKIAVCNLLLDVGSRYSSMHQDCKKLLTDLLEDVPLILHLLRSLQLPFAADPPRANKRAKTMETPQLSTDPLSSLTLLVEVLGTKSLPGSLDLISCLLETLHHVVQHALLTQADLSFVHQLLMSAIENVAEKITEVPNLSPSAIRLNTLVDLIRAASNPQIFNQALLLMAGLSRLAPESVLHNVMPVFTFMGSNVFHRDDTYSFRVVQKTINCIIPVMVSSLKSKYSDRLELYLGAKDFLRIFTDAANHVPRHRRTNFFAHLVDVLGPQDFLAPLLMLLVEKPSNRIVRQSDEEAKASLSIHLSILQHYPTSVQIFILAELLREALRLATRICNPEKVPSTFLEVSQDAHSSPPSALMKRLAQSLIILVGHAVKFITVSTDTGSDGEALGELVSLLIDIVTVQGIPIPEKDGIAKAARSAMSQVLSIMPATHFVHAVQAMLECGEEKVQTGALDLLTEHLPRVSKKTRQEIFPTIEKVLTLTHKLMSVHQEGPLATSTFRSLTTICDTASSGEEGCLTKFIPNILLAIKREKLTAPAMAILPHLTTRLGPRLIPNFRDIVTECIAVLRRTETKDPLLVQDTLSVLHGLLHSIPAFWTSVELTQVIALHLEFCASPSTKHTMSTLVRTMAKRAPSSTLLAALGDTWSSLSQIAKPDVYVGYFDLLKKALHSAPRAVVLEHLRPLFKVFLDALENIACPGDSVETHAISSFLEIVTKLNEASFKPIFRRLYDWAFAAETERGAHSRQISFCHAYSALLDLFKGLMTPYMSFLLQPFLDILKVFSETSSNESDLWLSVIHCLSQSFQHDGGAFWRDDKLRQITPILVEQVPVCVRFSNVSEGRTLFPDCLNNLVECVDDDTLLKTINLDVLMHTRSEDPRLRLFALTCSESLWRTHGGKLLGFVAETTSFMAECAEDENDSVVRQSHQLKNAVESVAGNIDGI